MLAGQRAGVGLLFFGVKEVNLRYGKIGLGESEAGGGGRPIELVSSKAGLLQAFRNCFSLLRKSKPKS